jgi:ABC-type bacteriocin/lantibiotic exporter with double-glycine peptidase domain
VAFSGDHRTAELSSTGNAQELITNLYSFSSPVTAFLYGLCGSLGITFLFLILISWMLVVLPVLFVVLLTILFRVAQSLAVRVAENPKGPQYVLGVMLGGAGTVVRYFTSFMAA